MHPLDEFKKFRMLTESTGDPVLSGNITENKKISEAHGVANTIFNNGLTPERYNITGRKEKCKNCGYDIRRSKDGKVSHANFRDDAACKHAIAEAWGTKMDTAPKDKGMFKGKTKEELKSQLAKLKKNPNKTEALKKKEKQIEFALRAKNKFGKIKESKDCCNCKNCKCDCHK